MSMILVVHYKVVNNNFTTVCPGQPGTHYADQAGLKMQALSATAL